MLIEQGRIEYMVLVNRSFIEKEDGSIRFHTYPNEEIPIVPQTNIILTKDSDGSNLIVEAFDGYDVFTLIKVGAVSTYFNRAEEAIHGINSMVSNDALPQGNIVRTIMSRIRKYLEKHSDRAQSTDEYIRMQHNNIRKEVSVSNEDVLRKIYRLRNKLIAHYDESTPSPERALEDNTNSNLISLGEFMGGVPKDDFENVLGRSQFFYGFFGILYNNIYALEKYVRRQDIVGI